MTDCLVLEISDSDNRKMYVMYDYYEEVYVIKGKQNLINYYSFNCVKPEEVFNYISLIFNMESNVNIFLHNYTCLPYETDAIEFDILDDRTNTNTYSGMTLCYNPVDNIHRYLIPNHLNALKSLYNNY